MADVVILLSTFNGEAFLREQLESLINQSFKEWKCLIRDDGSSDQTRKIVDEYVRLDSRFSFDASDCERLGPVASFARLLERAEPYSYFFFCDQDDLWLPRKVEKSLSLMREAESAYPGVALAVHTDLCVCDQDLKPLISSMKKGLLPEDDDGQSFARLVAQNFVTGCTLLLNRRLREQALPVPKQAMMHDWWIALVASALGKVRYLPEVTVHYRQHGRNASGSALLSSLSGGIKKFFGQHEKIYLLTRQRLSQSQALEKHLARYAPNAALFVLQDFHRAIARGSIAGIRAARRLGIRMSDGLRSAAYYYLLARVAREQRPTRPR